MSQLSWVRPIDHEQPFYEIGKVHSSFPFNSKSLVFTSFIVFTFFVFDEFFKRSTETQILSIVFG